MVNKSWDGLFQRLLVVIKLVFQIRGLFLYKLQCKVIYYVCRDSRGRVGELDSQQLITRICIDADNFCQRNGVELRIVLIDNQQQIWGGDLRLIDQWCVNLSHVE